MISASRGCCSGRARPGSIPTARWPRISSAARASAARASTPPRWSATAGVERVFDARLRDREAGTPLRLSIDLPVQTALEDVLAEGMSPS